MINNLNPWSDVHKKLEGLPRTPTHAPKTLPTPYNPWKPIATGSNVTLVNIPDTAPLPDAKLTPTISENSLHLDTGLAIKAELYPGNSPI